MILEAGTIHLIDILKIERLSFDQPWSVVHFARDINFNDSSFNWVAVKENKTVGFLFGWFTKDEYHLNNIAVHPEFRKRGIAGELLKFAINSNKANNVEKIYLEVRADNYPALKLYESFDFQAVGVRKDYYKKGDDAILYTLELNKNG